MKGDEAETKKIGGSVNLMVSQGAAEPQKPRVAHV